MDMHILETHFLIFKEDYGWTAQGLDYDITAQGKTIEEAYTAFKEQMGNHIFLAEHYNENPDKEFDPMAGFPQAPPKYWTMWHEIKKAKEESRKKNFSYLFLGT